MSLMSLVSCVSDAFYFYCVNWILIWYIFCHRMNHINSMMSLTNMGLTPDPLVCTPFTLFIWVLTSPLVVLVFWGLTFSHQQESIPKVIFFPLMFSYQQESSPKVVNSLKCFGAQIIYSLSKFENKFYIYSHSQTFPSSLQLLYYHQKYY